MTHPRELAEWLRSCDDGHNIDSALFQEAAAQLEALANIHAELDAQEWDSDTTDNIAQHLSSAGLDCAEPIYDEDDQ